MKDGRWRFGLRGHLWPLYLLVDAGPWRIIYGGRVTGYRSADLPRRRL